MLKTLADLHARLVECGLVEGGREVCVVQSKSNIQLLINEGLLQVSSVAKNNEICVIEHVSTC